MSMGSKIDGNLKHSTASAKIESITTVTASSVGDKV
jgi:hypothetical protein